MAYLLALFSALSYGGADFLGGLTTRRATAIAVVLISQFGGLVLLLLLLALMPPASASTNDMLWGAAAGIASGVGVSLLYHALAIGTMSVASPTTAVTAVSVPVLVSILLGERPYAIAIGGIALGIVSIVMVSKGPSTNETGPPPSSNPATPGHNTPSSTHAHGILAQSQSPAQTQTRRLPVGMVHALAAGTAFGVVFLALARAGHDAGIWPLIAMNAAAVALFGLVTLARRVSLRVPGTVLGLALIGGVFDMLAHALYMFATRGGPLTSVVTLASLYPASTVVLARLILRERLSRWQLAGIACALTAIALIVQATR
jgi:drug/metabolite transporter (DMT)-like permease